MRYRVAIVSFPWPSYAPYKFLSDLLKILDSISDNIVLICGNSDRVHINSKKVKIIDINIRMHFLREVNPLFYSVVLWIFKSILAQVKASLELIKMKKEVDIVLFYMASPYHLLPLIVSKILGKTTIEIITKSKSTQGSAISKIFSIQDRIVFRLLDGISPESNALVPELGLEKYRDKLLPEGARFIDTTKYKIKKDLNERMDIVGFVSRIRKEKGIVEFVKAIPLIAERNKRIKFLIGGSGDLLPWVKKECEKIKNKYNVDVAILGWLGEDLPCYLNELRLLVLPTYTDALPTIILEAMACGTPVLATSVGAIPEIIQDGETGFILRNHSPKSISEKVLKALNSSNLEQIRRNAWQVIEEKFTYTAAVGRYKKMFRLLGERQ